MKNKNHSTTPVPIATLDSPANRALECIHSFIQRTGMQDVKTRLETKSGVASISGYRDGVRYTTTMKFEDNGSILTQSEFDSNLSKDALYSQIHSLYKQGYTQVEIAEMLGISQSTVSKYLNS